MFSLKSAKIFLVFHPVNHFFNFDILYFYHTLYLYNILPTSFVILKTKALLIEGKR